MAIIRTFMLLSFFPSGIFSDESASTAGKSKPAVGKDKGDKGKAKAQNENPSPAAPYSLTEAQEEAIARWLESKKLIYDMKHKQYKNKALRRQLWEEKAAEYGVDCKYKKITLTYIAVNEHFNDCTNYLFGFLSLQIIQFRNGTIHRGLGSRSCGGRANPRRNPRRGPVVVCRVVTRKTPSLLRRPVRMTVTVTSSSAGSFGS